MAWAAARSPAGSAGSKRDRDAHAHSRRPCPAGPDDPDSDAHGDDGRRPRADPDARADRHPDLDDRRGPDAHPGRGLIAHALQRVRQRRAFYELMLAVHLKQHEGTPEEHEETRFDGLHRHLSWAPNIVAAVVARAESNGVVVRRGELLHLTDTGREMAKGVLG